MNDEGEETSEKSVFLDRVDASYNPSPRISTKSGIVVNSISPYNKIGNYKSNFI
jgi:hypothetical protein